MFKQFKNIEINNKESLLTLCKQVPNTLDLGLQLQSNLFLQSSFDQWADPLTCKENKGLLLKSNFFGGIGITKVIIRLSEKDIFVFCVFSDDVPMVIFYLP